MTTGTLDLSVVRAPSDWTRTYVGQGMWRSDTVLDDLRRWAAQTPDALAISAQREGQTTRISYREYAACVDRYAAALRELGVGPGQVVSLWLPARWQVLALMLACWKTGAVAAPVKP